ncbi:MAG: hypothetical protein DSZ05_09200 [Sulfurospirillum sp.]|nr:MAG: hypothetical protein DSZ05_09200 [Sulfurospirillum sp.]
MKQITGVVLILFLVGCGATDKKSQPPVQTESPSTQRPSVNPPATQNNTPRPETNTLQPETKTLQPETNISQSEEKTIYLCSNTLSDENSFTDTYIQHSTDDTDWSVSKYNLLKTEDIEKAFNRARANDPTVTKPMILPPQNIWDNYTESEKVLYLVNKERCDRGLRPFEGIDPKIKSEAQNYATYLKNHPDQYAHNPHEADGRTPWQRMAQDAGVIVNQNADFFQYGENIASLSIGSTGNAFPRIYESEARAVYGWMYQDKGESYGHRNFLMAKGLQENSGLKHMEGLIGIGKTTRQYQDGGYYWTQDILVMDSFDPRSSWNNDLASVKRIELYR